MKSVRFVYFNVLIVTLLCVFQWAGVLYFISNSRLSDKSICNAVVSMHILNVLGVFDYNCFNFEELKLHPDLVLAFSHCENSLLLIQRKELAIDILEKD